MSALLPQFAPPPTTDPTDPSPSSSRPAKDPSDPASGLRSHPDGPSASDPDASSSPRRAAAFAGAFDFPGLSGPRTDATTDTPSPSSTTSGSRWQWGKGSGKPDDVAKVIGGLLILVTASLGLLAARAGRDFRQPTPGQRDDISLPLARIACRHLPLGALGPDLADATTAVAATHSYLMDGPLIGHRYAPEPMPTEEI